MTKKIAALLGMTLASSVAMAQSDMGERHGWRFEPEFSIGAGYGLTKLKDRDFDEDEAAKKAFAVLKFNEYIGVEASYIDFDEAGNDVLELDADGKTLAIIFEAPINPAFSLYAKGGQLWWDADASVDSGIVDVSDDYDGDETFWGGGLKFRLAENLDLRVEYERFNFDISRDEIDVLQEDDIDMDVDMISANVQFSF